MALSHVKAQQVKHTGKPAGDKLAAGRGLYLLVKAAGKYWRMDYRYAGKRKTLALGVFPAVSLAQATQRRDDARRLLADGTDPGVIKKTLKAASIEAVDNTFEAVARELHATKVDGWSKLYGVRWIERIEKDLFPYIGALPLAQVTAPILLNALRRVESRGVYETAHTLLQTAGQVFRYGVRTGRCEIDPAASLRGALVPVITRHMAAILEPDRLGEFLRAAWGYTGYPATKAALQLSALLFQRPGNIRMMEWSWINLDKAMLTILAQDMKRPKAGKINGRPHFVPLAPQAVVILSDLQSLTGYGRYVFPGIRTGEKPMSENTVNAAMRGLGFTRDEVTAHGFRATAQTMMLEQIPGISPDAIEAQLAHGKRGPLGSAYDRTEYMEQRRAMMAQWANYLDRLRIGAEVIPLKPDMPGCRYKQPKQR